MTDQLKQALENATKEKKLPGTGIVGIDKSGKQIINVAAGVINVDDSSSTAYTNDTELLVWSCTKLVTSLCVLQLLEQGKISSINDPVSKYLPSEADVKIFTKFDSDGKPQFRNQEKEIKLVHLFTHTSGYTYDFWGEETFKWRQSTGDDRPPGTYVGIGANWQFEQPLFFDAGARYHYGLNIDKLGFIVEALSGMTLPEYMKKNIFEPLGMKRTGSHYIDQSQSLVVHIKDQEGKLTAVPAIAAAANPDKYGGGHFMISTLNDYSQILLALLNDGKHPGTKQQILKPETIRDYVFHDFIPEIGADGSDIGVIPVSMVPSLSNSGEFLKGVPKGWSCGLMLNKSNHSGGRSADSGAWAGLGNLFYWIDRAEGKAGILGTSVLPFMDATALDLFEMFEKEMYKGSAQQALPARGEVDELVEVTKNVKV